MAWSQILCEASDEAQSPMQLFKESIHAYRQRKRFCLARASIQSHHAASGKFQFSYKRSGVFTQIDTPPNHMSIIHYGTDEGVYLEYRFEQHQVDYEVYLPSVDSAKQKAQWDFDVRPDDWIAEAPDPSKLGDERGDFDR